MIFSCSVSSKSYKSCRICYSFAPLQLIICIYLESIFVSSYFCLSSLMSSIILYTLDGSYISLSDSVAVITLFYPNDTVAVNSILEAFSSFCWEIRPPSSSMCSLIVSYAVLSLIVLKQVKLKLSGSSLNPISFIKLTIGSKTNSFVYICRFFMGSDLYFNSCGFLKRLSIIL